MPTIPVVVSTDQTSLRLHVAMDRVATRPGLPPEDAPVWAVLSNLRFLYQELRIGTSYKHCTDPQAAASVHVGVPHNAITRFRPRKRATGQPLSLSFHEHKERSFHTSIDNFSLHLNHETGTTDISACLANPLAALLDETGIPKPRTVFEEATHLISGQGPAALKPSAQARERHWAVVVGILDTLRREDTHPVLPDPAVLALLGTMATQPRTPQPDQQWAFQTATAQQLFYAHLLTSGPLQRPNTFIALPPLQGLVERADPHHLALGRALASEAKAMNALDAKGSANALADTHDRHHPFANLDASEASAHQHIVHAARMGRIAAIIDANR